MHVKINRQEMVKKIKNIDFGQLFIFKDKTIDSGVFMKISPEPFYGYSSCSNLVTKIFDSEEEINSNRSSACVGCVKEVDMDENVYLVEPFSTITFNIC